jgi:putative lipoic acid-binding regulatory protein
MINLNNHTLKLNYPCKWRYKIIIREQKDIVRIMKEILNRREHNIQPSKKSNGGKFKSFTLDILVNSEDDRQELYKLLTIHEHIKMVV